MSELEKLFCEKTTENGDQAYNTTGNNLTDILFMSDYFQKNLNEVNIGQSEKEKLFSMYVRDPRHGMGKRDLGRQLMKLSGVHPEDVVIAGRYDDLWHNPTNDNLGKLALELTNGNELTKKWMPRLTSTNKKFANALRKYYELTPKQYRELIKCESTVEYKLSYAELKSDSSPLNKLFHEGNYAHPLVETIDFEKVPSLAMTKYLKAFATREDTKDRFAKYIQDVKDSKAKLNTATANVHNAYKNVVQSTSTSELAAEVVSQKIIEQETNNLELNCICILDTSASMGGLHDASSEYARAMSVAHAISTNSTYAKNQLISFSSKPKLMTIKGKTLKEQYSSMHTGDVSNTDFGAVMKLLQQLQTFPEFLLVLSDMEFDHGSRQSKEETMRLFRENGAKTRIIWWNFNDRNRTSPEIDEYGNVYMSGENIQALLQVPGVMDMEEYINNLLAEYAKKIGK